MRRLGLGMVLAWGSLVACVGDSPVGNGDSGSDGSSASDGSTDVSTATDAAADSNDVDAGPYEIVDDMESQTGQLVHLNGRNGTWFAFNDGSDGGVQIPFGSAIFPEQLAPPRGSSQYAMHTHGSGWVIWGASTGFSLNGGNYYNLTPYTGFTFWMKASQAVQVRIQMTDRNTTSGGGVCTTSCADYFGSDLAVTTSWQSFVVSFVDLHQQGWGQQFTALKQDEVASIVFSTDTQATSFDYWVDDVYLIKN